MHTKQNLSVLALAATLSTAVLTGCIDQDYSLEDIDTKMEFQVNDLALPLNIAPVKLSSLVDLTSEECIEEVNGEYVLVKTGEFKSSPISIQGIHAVAVKENNDVNEIKLPMVVPGVKVPLTEYIHQFNYNYDDVDKYIVKIIKGQVDLTLSLEIATLYDNNGGVLDADFSNLKIKLPAGFYGTLSDGTVIDAAYEKKNGSEVTIKNASVNSKGIYRLDFHVTEFDMAAAGGHLNDVTRDFTLSTGMGIVSGDIVSKSTKSAPATITVTFSISPLDVISITGEIWYEVKDLMTDQDILFNDLPDVLTDPETKLSFFNPQLYLSIENPLGAIAYATTGLTIEQIRSNGEKPAPAALAKPLTIGNKEGYQDYCLLPRPSDLSKPYYKYPNAELCQMNNLGNIVYGDGLPAGLKIDFVNPVLPDQTVDGFKLDWEGQITGNYTLFAPLQLNAGSAIYYKDTVTGWGLTSDSDEMEIKYLTLDADITSHLPVDVYFTAIPVNSDGEEITSVKVNKVEVPAGQTSHVTITMEGTILDLDGMSYIASFKSVNDSKVLRPDASLDIANLKVRVTGNYIIDEDEDEDDNY